MKDPKQGPLDAFIADIADLERLEVMLDNFNLFEAIGVVRQELRHSHLLAYLLNPRKNHGLKDAFVKHLLKKVLIDIQDEDRDVPIPLIDLDTWDFYSADVLREWRSIDIFFIDTLHDLAVIIENKIDTGEHSDQLQRYYQQVQHAYPECRIIALYLTPDGTPPSEDKYIAINYSLICTTLEELLVSRAVTLNNEVVIMIRHYTQMLRRHIMDNSEIADLCRDIYLKHQQALDLIYEYRFDRQTIIRGICEDLIKQQSELIQDETDKRYIRFRPKAWDFDALRKAKRYTSSNRILLFEFVNDIGSLKLDLVIGPGPLEIQQKLNDMFQPGAEPLKPSNKRRWIHISVLPIFKRESYEDSMDEITEVMRDKWHSFIKDKLPELDAVIKAQEWITQSPRTGNLL